MWDKATICNLIILSISIALFDVYLVQLFWGNWTEIRSRALYYCDTSLVLIYLTISDYLGFCSEIHFEVNIISKITIIINFIFFALALYNFLPSPVYTLILFNGSILVVSLTILILGLKHEIFKD